MEYIFEVEMIEQYLDNSPIINLNNTHNKFKRFYTSSLLGFKINYDHIITNNDYTNITYIDIEDDCSSKNVSDIKECITIPHINQSIQNIKMDKDQDKTIFFIFVDANGVYKTHYSNKSIINNKLAIIIKIALDSIKKISPLNVIPREQVQGEKPLNIIPREQVGEEPRSPLNVIPQEQEEPRSPLNVIPQEQVQGEEPRSLNVIPQEQEEPRSPLNVIPQEQEEPRSPLNVIPQEQVQSEELNIIQQEEGKGEEVIPQEQGQGKREQVSHQIQLEELRKQLAKETEEKKKTQMEIDESEIVEKKIIESIELKKQTLTALNKQPVINKTQIKVKEEEIKKEEIKKEEITKKNNDLQKRMNEATQNENRFNVEIAKIEQILAEIKRMKKEGEIQADTTITYELKDLQKKLDVELESETRQQTDFNAKRPTIQKMVEHGGLITIIPIQNELISKSKFDIPFSNEKLSQFRKYILNTIYKNNIILKLNSLSSENLIDLYKNVNIPDSENINFIPKLIKQFLNIIFVDINYFKLFDIFNKKLNSNDQSTRAELIEIRDFFSSNLDGKEITYEEIQKDINNVIVLNTHLKLKEQYGTDTIRVEYVENRIKTIKTLGEDDESPNIILHILRFIKICKTVIENPDKYKTYFNTGKLLVDMINSFIKNTELNIESILETLNMVTGEHKITFIKKLNEYIKSQNEDNIITYLKLTNKHKDQDFNRQRFRDLQINKKEGLLYFNYNHDSLQHYVKNKNDNFFSIINNVSNPQSNQPLNTQFNTTSEKYISPTANTKFPAFKNKNAMTADVASRRTEIRGGEGEINKSISNKYLFGKFTQIFDPKLSNKDIAFKINEVYEKAISGKPIFMIGYGASGAGKTSSLIYFNGGTPNEKDGIIINLCKRFGVENYSSLTLSIREFYDSYNTSVCNNETGNCNVDELTFEFDKNVNNYIYKKNEAQSALINKFHEYRSLSDKINETDGITLGQLMIYYIDTDRLVKATTNNPNSSRSHSIIYLKITKINSNPIQLFIGDFAGVENKFKCEDITIIDKFREIAEKGLPNVSGSKDFFIDPINKISVENGGGKMDSQISSTYTNIMNEIKNNKSFDFYFSKDVVKNFESEYRKIFNTDDALYNIKTYFNDDIKFSKLLEFITVKMNKDISMYDTRKLQITPVLKRLDTEFNNVSIPENTQSKFDSMLLSIFGFNDTNIPKYISDMTEYTKLNFSEKRKNPEFSQLGVDRIHSPNVEMNGFKNNKFGTGVIQLGSNDPVFANRELETKRLLDIFTKTDDYKTNILNYIKQQVNSLFKIDKKNFTMLYPYSFVTKNTGSVSKVIVLPKMNMVPMEIVFDSTLLKTKLLKYIYKSYKTSEDTSFLLLGTNPPVFHFTKDTPKNNTSTNKPLFKPTPPSLLYKPSDYFMYFDFKQLNDGSTIQTLFKSANDKLKTEIKEITDYNLVEENISKITNKYDLLKKHVTNIYNMVKFVKTICYNRVKEGLFINQSLKGIRNTIRNIMIEKNTDKIYYSPDYMDYCLDKYCPTGIDCFNINDPNTKNNIETIESPIFKYIYELLKKNTDIANYTIQTFYKEIIISIFCVFNISMSANDPPPVRYIDINKLKNTFRLLSINKTQNNSKELIEMLNLVKQNIETENDSKNDLGSIFPNITVIVNLLSSTTAIKSISEIKQNMEIIIELIDNYNAATTIGTLEFIDQNAKLNSVENSCYDFDIDSGENKNGFENIETMLITQEQLTQPTQTTPTQTTPTQTQTPTQTTTQTQTQTQTQTPPLTDKEKMKQRIKESEQRRIKSKSSRGGIKHNITRKKSRK
jgi:hypothetical protein